MLLNRTAITNLDDLSKWWESDPERPYWTLYRGVRPSKQDVIARNDTIEDLAGAWEVLQQMLFINSTGGGEFLILRSDKPKGNYGHKVVVVLNMSPQSAPGIGGMMSPTPFIGEQPAIQAVIEKEVEKAKHAWELERKVEDLEAAINAGNEGTGLERVFNRIIDHPKIDTILEVLLVKLLGPKPQTHVAVSGVPTSEEEGFQYDTDRVINALEGIREHFPDIHSFLDRLAAYVQANPEMAKTIFKQIG